MAEQAAGWTSCPVTTLAAAQDASAVPLPPGHGAIVVDSWRARWDRQAHLAPLIMVDGDCFMAGWSRVHVAVPAGPHVVVAAPNEGSASSGVARVLVASGQVVELDCVSWQIFGTSARFVVPGSRVRPWLSLPLSLGLHVWLALLLWLGAAVVGWSVVALLRLIGAVRSASPVVWLHDHAGPILLWTAGVFVVAGLVRGVHSWLFPGGFGRWRRSKAVREVAQRAVAEGGRASDGARFLGDGLRGRVPDPTVGQGAVRLRSRWTRFPAAFSVSHQEPFLSLPRGRRHGLELTVDGRSSPADVGVWWIPVPAGSVRLTVSAPMPASLELEVAAGQTVDVEYWAHLMGDRLEPVAYVPELSGVVLVQGRLGRTDEPALPGRKRGGLLTDDQVAAVRERSKRREDPGR